MRLLEGVIVAGFMIASNVVAAGVILVLGLTFQLAAPSWDSPWPWFVICALGAAAAYLFLKGAIASAAGYSRLQCRSSRRGG